jgi:hypothetical protein
MERVGALVGIDELGTKVAISRVDVVFTVASAQSVNVRVTAHFAADVAAAKWTVDGITETRSRDMWFTRGRDVPTPCLRAVEGQPGGKQSTRFIIDVAGQREVTMHTLTTAMTSATATMLSLPLSLLPASASMTSVVLNAPALLAQPGIAATMTKEWTRVDQPQSAAGSSTFETLAPPTGAISIVIAAAPVKGGSRRRCTPGMVVTVLVIGIAIVPHLSRLVELSKIAAGL